MAITPHGEGRPMPIYEYRCKECGHIFERLTLRKDNEGEVKCPKCDGAAEKIMSVPQEPVMF